MSICVLWSMKHGEWFIPIDMAFGPLLSCPALAAADLPFSRLINSNSDGPVYH